MEEVLFTLTASDEYPKIRAYIDFKGFQTRTDTIQFFQRDNKYNVAAQRVIDEYFNIERIDFKRSHTYILFNRNTQRAYIFRGTRKKGQKKYRYKPVKQKPYAKYLRALRGKKE